jgi:hypothetical protein
MRNLTKRGLGFYSPHKDHLFSSAFRPKLDREEVRYGWRRLRGSGTDSGLTRGLMAVGRGLRDPRALAVICVFVVALTISSMLFGGSESSSAALFPVNVRGFVRDISGNPIQGANVTVEMMNGPTVVSTKYYDTISTGLYSVTFAGSEWDINDTIRVTATYGIYTNQNSTVATTDPIQYVNVTLSMSIPEFGSVMGLSTSFVTMGLIAVIVTVSRRRKDRLAP